MKAFGQRSMSLFRRDAQAPTSQLKTIATKTNATHPWPKLLPVAELTITSRDNR
jgi:hypothetical protein